MFRLHKKFRHFGLSGPTTAAYLGRTDQGHPDGHTQALLAWGHQMDIPGLTAYLNKLISGFALRVLVFSAGPPWDWYVFTKLFLAHELLAVAVLFRRFHVPPFSFLSAG